VEDLAGLTDLNSLKRPAECGQEELNPLDDGIGVR
jgi:hypothetical protein